MRAERKNISPPARAKTSPTEPPSNVVVVGNRVWFFGHGASRDVSFAVCSRERTESASSFQTLTRYVTCSYVSQEAADGKKLKRAFRKLCLRYHPDIAREEGAVEKFQELQEAYRVLADDGEGALDVPLPEDLEWSAHDWRWAMRYNRGNAGDDDETAGGGDRPLDDLLGATRKVEEAERKARLEAQLSAMASAPTRRKRRLRSRRRRDRRRRTRATARATGARRISRLTKFRKPPRTRTRSRSRRGTRARRAGRAGTSPTGTARSRRTSGSTRSSRGCTAKK